MQFVERTIAKVTRKINWISSLKRHKTLQELELALASFYSNNKNYYSDIDSASTNWVSKEGVGYKRIVDLAYSHETMCEIGCGNANILKYYPEFAEKYTGLDFSESLQDDNSRKYRGARFFTFKKPNKFPVADQQFDLVFSVFVLEHVIRPSVFLDECTRILKPGGTLVILCPDFLGRGRMSSQRAGFSEGNASKKLKRRNFFDALVTLFDNRIRIPLACKFYRNKAAKKPLFLINSTPVVFEDEFQPDVDAVYLTYKAEIAHYLENTFEVYKNDPDISNYEHDNKLIFLQMTEKIA